VSISETWIDDWCSQTTFESAAGKQKLCIKALHTHLDSRFKCLKFPYLVQTLQIIRTLSSSVCPNIGRFVLLVSGHISIYLHHYFVPVILPCSNKDKPSSHSPGSNKIYTIQISKLNKEARKSTSGVDINSNYKLTL
jgi:hypothetical protein